MNMGGKPRPFKIDDVEENLRNQVSDEILKTIQEFNAKNKPIGIEYLYLLCEKP